jgi:hypothetical protein
MTSADFVIDQVSWHTGTLGNPESRVQILARFGALRRFLVENGLLARELAEVDDRFSVKASDLSEEGFALMKAAYDGWLRRIDRGADPDDTGTLDKALRKLRAAAS